LVLVIQKQDAVVTIGEHGHARKQKHAFRGGVWEADALGDCRCRHGHGRGSAHIVCLAYHSVYGSFWFEM